MFCKILTSVPRGSPTFGEIKAGDADECPKAFRTAGTRVETHGLEEGDRAIENMIRPLLDLSINTHGLLLAEIRRLKNFPEKD